MTLIELCPSSFDTISIETPLSSSETANVSRNRCGWPPVMAGFLRDVLEGVLAGRVQLEHRIERQKTAPDDCANSRISSRSSI